MSTDSFIPQDYKVPSGSGGFTKLENGDNKFRILSNPLMMWVSWVDGKPYRSKFDLSQKPSKGPGPKDSVKHAWGLVVWNYSTSQVEVMELDKQSIISGIATHAKDPDWGHPKNYDIVINKSGVGMDTEYKLICKPQKELSQDIIDAFIDNPVDLSQLLVDGGNVFMSPASDEKTDTPAPPTSDQSEAPKTSKGLPF